MNIDLIRRAWERAGRRCEYCQLPSVFYPAPFQIDHIIARQHGGKTELENLALACIHCNRFKGPNVAGLDPDTREIVRLFHPRHDNWAERFVWAGPELKGRPQIGWVTIAVLVINDPEIVDVRRALQDEGAFWRQGTMASFAIQHGIWGLLSGCSQMAFPGYPSDESRSQSMVSFASVLLMTACPAI